MHNSNRKLVAGAVAAALGAGIIVLATTSLPAVLVAQKPVDCGAPAATDPGPSHRDAIHVHVHRTPKLPAPPPPPTPAPVA